MVLTPFNNSLLYSSVEQNLFNITGLKNHSGQIFLDALISGDSVEIITYIKDIGGAVFKVYRKETISFDVDNLTNEPVYNIPPVQSDGYKVSIRKISGTDRTVNWNRYEQ